MKSLCRKIYRREKGFTLVELMVVIIILAILTGIAIPSYMALRDRARTSATESEMRNIATALELYNADQEEYPDALADLATGGYMDPVPTLDAWEIAYVYTCASPFTTYTLESLGSDNAQGADDIMIQDGIVIPWGTAPNT